MSELVLAGVILSGAWTQLDEIGWLGWAPLILVFVLEHVHPTRLRRLTFPPQDGDRGASIAAAALCALPLAHVALTFREEFGFGGDEGYHLSATRAFALYFMQAGPLLLAVAGGYALLKRKGFRYASTVSMAALIAASYALPASALFGRYPTAFYLIATPLNVAFDLLHSPYPYSANHVINTLSAPVWLFVLRPLVLGRWPDWRVLPVALLVYFQPTSLTLLSSPMLEPWAIVFALLSLEGLVTLAPERRWIAVAMCAIAICFKETMFLLLPSVWLLASVDRRNGRPSLRPGSIAVGLAAVAPFIIYYAVRAELTMSRGYAFGATAFTQARAIEWIANARSQIGVGGLLAIAAAALFSITSGPLWIATAGAIAVFFLADTISIPWTGYSRFLVYSLLAVCGALFAAIERRDPGRRALMVGCVLLIALQLSATLTTFALDFGPDHARNSLEWNGSLVRLPIRKLASQIPARSTTPVQRVKVIAFASDLISLPVAYPDIASRYTLEAASSDCSCRQPDQAIIAGFEWPANLANAAEAHAAFDRIGNACMQQAEATCAAIVTERGASGALIGLLGVGVR